MSQSIGPKHNFINPEIGRIARIVLISATSTMKIHALPEKKLRSDFFIQLLNKALLVLLNVTNFE
jgi:hypothetical protein